MRVSPLAQRVVLYEEDPDDHQRQDDPQRPTYLTNDPCHVRTPHAHGLVRPQSNHALGGGSRDRVPVPLG